MAVGMVPSSERAMRSGASEAFEEGLEASEEPEAAAYSGARTHMGRQMGTEVQASSREDRLDRGSWRTGRGSWCTDWGNRDTHRKPCQRERGSSRKETLSKNTQINSRRVRGY